MRKAVLSILLGSAVLLHPVSFASVSSAKSAPQQGTAAPGFTLVDLVGNRVSLAGLKGRVVLLNFWSVRCAPCVQEMPSLNRLFQRFDAEGFMVLAVAIDRADPVRDFVRQHALAFPVLLDTEKETAFDLYAAMDLPESFLIDKDGIIVETFNGPREWESPEMQRLVKGLLRTPRGDQGR